MIFNPVYGGDASATLGSKTITANGTYSASSDGLDGYDAVTANVPNTYSAGDEGKVVSSGALVAQASTTKTANGVYDTTLNNEVVVDVQGGGQPLLPSAYQQVEWVGSSASDTQYIETGVVPSFNVNVIVDYKLITTKSDNNGVLCGSRQGSDGSKRFFPASFANSTINERHVFGSSSTVVNYSYHMRHKADFNNDSHQVVVDDYTVVTLSSSSFSGNTNTIWLFCCHDASDTPAFAVRARIYSFVARAIDTGVKLCELIPCYRKSDNVIGFYDLVSDTFRTNLGTGSLEKGADTQSSGGATLITKTITANGTYNAADDSADGYSQVVVCVSGGGGGRTVYESTSTPTAADGNPGDFCVEKTPSAASIVSDEGANRLYTFNLTKLGRETNLNFTYYGISGIELVFEDSGGNQYLLSQTSDKNAKVKNNNATSYIGVISTGYSESNGLPGIVTASGTIPSGYKLTTIKIAQRNSTSWKDFWVDFNVVETVNGVSNTIFTKSGMSYSDWSGPGAWTFFSLAGGEYVNTYAKVDASTWVPVSDLTAVQIAALNLTPL